MNQHTGHNDNSKLAGGIILCGGRSRRMGKDKPTLPFGPETLIERTIRILDSVLSPIIVVSHNQQPLPRFPDKITLVHDELPDLGPMGGLLTGLHAMTRLAPQVEYAYVSSCDAPFLKPEFISKMMSLAIDHEIAVPYDGKYHHSLSAVYKTNLADRIQNLINDEQLRPLHLFEQSKTNQILCEDLKEIDPDLESLINTNTTEDYNQALLKAGFSNLD